MLFMDLLNRMLCSDPAKRISPQEIILTPEEAKQVAEGRAKASQVGYKVPGKAKVDGDSYSNDNVPMNLPQGGVVVKRTKAKSRIKAKSRTTTTKYKTTI
jgi:hypothetical protein